MIYETKIDARRIAKTALKEIDRPRMSKKQRTRLMAEMGKRLDAIIAQQAANIWGFAATTPKANPKDWDAAPEGFVSMWPT